MKKIPKIKINHQSGSAMLVAVVFFLFISVAIISGLVGPTVREFANANINLNSKKSYFLAESGSEDAFYRIKKNMAVSSSESLTIDSGSVVTAISDDGLGKKSISSLGDVSGAQRKTSVAFSVGAGSSFNYGVQVGEGGLKMENSSSVSGNVFSNGPITGTAKISSNPSNPDYISSVNVGPNANSVVWNGSYLYVANESNIQTVDVSNPALPRVVSTVNNPDMSSNAYQKDIAVSNGYLFVTASNHNNVVAFSISDPTHPVYVGQVSVPVGPYDIDISGSYAYVLSYANCNNGGCFFTTINISNPSAMSVTSSIATGANPIEMTIRGGYIYVADQAGLLEIFSLANPASPVKVGSTAITANPIPIAVSGSYAYIGSKGASKLEIVNVSNPASPVLVSGSTVNSVIDPKGLYAAGSYLYVAVSYTSNVGKFQVWDISNPNVWSNVKTVDISGGMPVRVIGGQSGYIYLLTQKSNAVAPLMIYQISGSGGNTITGDAVSAGPSGSISQIHATNSLYAHNIADSLAGKDAYYKNISNTTILGLSYSGSPDQTPATMPIPDSDISQWESDAAAYAVINSPCPYVISGSSSVTLGPAKINCSLELSNSASINLTGNVWVKGSVTLGNQGTISVDPSISGKTIGIIADNPTNRTTSSKITISNTSNYRGSGTNSYIMLISQNNSAEIGGGEEAITISNNVTGNVLLYAPHGKIDLSNNISIKEVTGWKILLQNSAQVIYETGLANLLFTSGPAGGFVFDKWGESQ